MNNESKKEIVYDIYREIYRKAVPRLDFDEERKIGGKLHEKTDRDRPFMDHFLPEKNQLNIIEKHCKENDLRDSLTSMVRSTVLLGASPTSSFENWNLKKDYIPERVLNCED